MEHSDSSMDPVLYQSKKLDSDTETPEGSGELVFFSKSSDTREYEYCL